MCAQLSCPLVLFAEGTLRVVTLSDPGRLSARALYTRAVLHLGLGCRGGGGRQKRARRCACVTGAPETLGMCARRCVCAQLSCPSNLLWYFFPPGPLSSLRESVITRALRSLPSSHGCQARWVPSSCSYHIAGRNTLTTGISPMASLESRTASAATVHTVSLATCSHRLLGQSAYASHPCQVSLPAASFAPFTYPVNFVTQVTGAAPLALSAVS